MTKPWLGQNGKVILHASGGPLLSDLCPCCPCDTWPPASWPCGGLKQTYSIAGTRTVLTGSLTEDTRVINSGQVITAVSGTRCKWSGYVNCTWNRYRADGTNCFAPTADTFHFSLIRDNCGIWRLYHEDGASTWQNYNPPTAGPWVYPDVHVANDGAPGSGPEGTYTIPGYQLWKPNADCGFNANITFDVQPCVITIS